MAPTILIQNRVYEIRSMTAEAGGDYDWRGGQHDPASCRGLRSVRHVAEAATAAGVRRTNTDAWKGTRSCQGMRLHLREGVQNL